ncbi:MAG: DUF1134 domain-containing protein [Sphingobium sp.]
MTKAAEWIGRGLKGWSIAIAIAGLAIAPVHAQVQTVEPNDAIDADLAPPGGTTSVPADPAYPPPIDQPAPAGQPPAAGATTVPVSPDPRTSYQKDDVVSAAEGVFGKGAEGLASLIEKILKDQGEPNAYIAGREASGAIVVGLRYGSGTLNHKIEGKRDVYWTGPSIGFDVGGNASKVFVLVYNLYDTEELYTRFPGAEGALYVVGGFTATYLRKGNVVLIPIRLGVGWRAGINAGYMKFTKKSRIIPF